MNHNLLAVADAPADDAAPPHLEDARREARFTYAKRRIQKIVDGAPPLTADQRRRLAALLMQEAA